MFAGWSIYRAGINPWGKTDYAANSEAVLPRGQNLTLAVITDGTSNTLCAGEKAMDPGLYGGTSSSNWDEVIYSGGYGGTGRSGTTIVQDAPGDPFGNNWGSPFPGGCPFAHPV